MKYMGSKNKIAGCIVPIITKDLRKYNYYVEPFMGGCNLLDKIQHPKRIGADSNEYLVALFQALQKGWLPPESVSEEEYFRLKKDETADKVLRAFVGSKQNIEKLFVHESQYKDYMFHNFEQLDMFD